MKTTELMIGDWVQDRSDQSYLRIDSHWTLYNAKDFEPIPITSDILKLNGFVRSKKGLSCKWRFSTMECGTILGSQLSTGFWIFDIAGTFVIPTGRFQGYLTYVHELQHALNLCKVDKKIVL